MTAREIFYRLSTCQRGLLVALCVAAYAFLSGPALVSNVLPHWLHVINADRTINAGEVSNALYLTGAAVFLTAAPMLVVISPRLLGFGITLTSTFII